MGYYRAGDYYRGGGYYRAGGIFSSIGKALGGVAKVAAGIAGFVPGVGTVASAGLGLLGQTLSGSTAIPGGGPRATLQLPSGAAPRLTPAPPRGYSDVPGFTGTMQRLVPGGASGYRRNRRMNPGNAKAARRAIRRMKAVRHLLQGLEREMPHKPCHREHKAARR